MVEERPVHVQVKPDGTMSYLSPHSLFESAASLLQQKTKSRGADTGSELPAGSGAPSDGYTKCADKDGTCTCEDGEVRYGSTETKYFTHPMSVGKAGEKFECTLNNLALSALSVPDEEGGQNNEACYCNERYVHIQIDLGQQAEA